MGLSITGDLAPEAAMLRKGGLRAGQRLILTRPLGTGVVLAADMQGLAPGRCVAATHASMLRGNAEAARVARACAASACTDVSGFGLAGHLARDAACEPRLRTRAFRRGACPSLHESAAELDRAGRAQHLPRAERPACDGALAIDDASLASGDPARRAALRSRRPPADCSSPWPRNASRRRSRRSVLAGDVRGAGDPDAAVIVPRSNRPADRGGGLLVGSADPRPSVVVTCQAGAGRR